MEVNKSILKKVKDNNRTAILKLYEASYNLLMSVAVRYYHNQEDQMEIVNTSFIKILDNIDKFKVGTNYFAWAKTITHRIVIDKFRKDKNYKDHFIITEDNKFQYLQGLQETSEEEIYELIDTYKAEEIEKILNQLPPASRITFNLFAIEGYSYKEIAEELDVSYETVKWHIKESRKRLKAILIENTLEFE